MAELYPIALYEPAPLRQRKAIALCVLAFVLLCEPLVGRSFFHIHDRAGFDLIDAAAIVAAIAAAIFAWSALQPVGKIWANHIEVHGYGMFKKQIAGYRPYKGDIHLVNRDPEEGWLTIPAWLLNDPVFQNWFGPITNLSAEDYRQSLETLESDPALGATVEDRRISLNRMRRVSSAVTAAAWAASAWCLFYPHPYWWALTCAAVVPPVAVIIYLVSGSQFAMGGERKNEARPSLLSAYLVPAVALALRAFVDFGILDVSRLLAITLAIGAFSAAALSILERRSSFNPLDIAARVFFCSLYFYGVVVTENVYLDKAGPTSYRVQVLNKRISSGKHTSYNLDLAQWGPTHKSGEMDVGSDFYDRVNRGDHICVYVYAGAFRIRWYSPGFC